MIKKSLLYSLSILFSGKLVAFEFQEPSRLVLKDLTYSTAYGGSIEFGFAKQFRNNQILMASLGMGDKGSAIQSVGLDYSYYFNVDSTVADSWFAGGGIKRKFDVENPMYSNSSSLAIHGGYQWAWTDFAVSLHTSLSVNDKNNNFVSVGPEFIYMF